MKILFYFFGQIFLMHKWIKTNLNENQKWNQNYDRNLYYNNNNMMNPGMQGRYSNPYNNYQQQPMNPYQNMSPLASVGLNIANGMLNRNRYGYNRRMYSYNSGMGNRDSFSIIEEMQRSNQVKQIRSILTEFGDRLDDLAETINHRLNEINTMLDRNSILRSQQMGMGQGMVNGI